MIKEKTNNSDSREGNAYDVYKIISYQNRWISRRYFSLMKFSVDRIKCVRVKTYSKYLLRIANSSENNEGKKRLVYG